MAVHDFIIRSINTQKLTCLCMLDLSSAFDTIDHSILLHRLQMWFGVRGQALSWFKSYLSNRKFTVRIDSHQSSPSNVPFGVPQGSVLGPLLFTLYTTPLSSLISSLSHQHHLFADDTQLFASFSPSFFNQQADSLQNTFTSISSWMSSNFLTLNSSKTEFIIFGNSHQLAKLQNPCLCLNNTTLIQPVPSARNLGFIFDRHLSLHDQITAISKACFYHIRDLRRLRSSLNLHTASIIATSLVQTKLDYCNSLYLNLPDCEINRLQFIQNSLARAVTQSSRFAHITPVLKSLHWLKIKERILYKIISITYKTLETSQPVYLSELLTLHEGPSTRSSNLVTLQRPPNPSRSKISDRSYYFAAPQIWNSLPPQLRQPCSKLNPNNQRICALSHATFHAQLKTHLFLMSYPQATNHPNVRPPRKPPQ